jgi:SAM-dependent methyltransferase
MTISGDDLSRDWAAFWNEKANSQTDFQATGRSVLDIVAYLYLIRDITLNLRLKPSDHLLDIGCGTGIVALALSGFVSKIHAVDISSNMVNRARNNCAEAPNITFAQGTLLEPGVNPESYSKVLAYSVLQYLPDESSWSEAFSVLSDILSPGGTACYAANADLDKKRAYIDNVLTSDRQDAQKQHELDNIDAVSWVAPLRAVELASAAGLRAEYRPMSSRIWQHFYMYDLVLQKDN